jgi:hypothetical protein
MGGAGEGTSRMIYEYGDTYSVSAAGRIEEFYDMRWGDTVEELHQQAVSALAEDSQGELNIHTIVAPGVTVGTQPYDNFYLGDTVDVVIDGELLHAQVQEVGILDREDGTHEHATFGSYRSWRKGIDGLKGITALTRRLSRLETTS